MCGCGKILATLKAHAGESKAQFIASKLVENAFDVYRRLSEEEKKDPEGIKTSLLNEFCREERNREEALNALMHTVRKSGETPQAFSYRILKLTQLAYASIAANTQNSIAKDYFMKGLSSELQVAIKSVTGFKDKTLQQACDEATRLEIAGVGSSGPSPHATSVASVETASQPDLVEQITSGVIERLRSSNLLGNSPDMDDDVNFVSSGGRGRGNNNNFRGSNRGRSRGRRNPQNNQSGRRCRVCQSEGHLFRNCPQRHCQACGRTGHDAWSVACPNYS